MYILITIITTVFITLCGRKSFSRKKSDKLNLTTTTLLIMTMTLTMTMTMVTDLLNITVAKNCYERAQALHAI